MLYSNYFLEVPSIINLLGPETYIIPLKQPQKEKLATYSFLHVIKA